MNHVDVLYNGCMQKMSRFTLQHINNKYIYHRFVDYAYVIVKNNQLNYNPE